MESQQPDDDELDSVRIRRISDLRRSTARGRSHAIIIALAALVCALQIAITLIRHWRASEMGWIDIAYGVAILALVLLFDMSFRRAGRLNRELKRSAVPDPDRPPDFSTLSNGSQWADNLEQVRDDSEP